MSLDNGSVVKCVGHYRYRLRASVDDYGRPPKTSDLVFARPDVALVISRATVSSQEHTLMLVGGSTFWLIIDSFCEAANHLYAVA